MRILKTYVREEDKKMSYSTNSKLLKEIRNLYGCDEVVLGADCDEHKYAQLIRQYDVLLTMWGNAHIPNELAQNPGNLKYICNITGEISKWIDIDIVESPYITVTNWGDAAAYSVAEGAFALLMAVMKNIPGHIQNTKSGALIEGPECVKTQTTLYGRRVGIYGLGYIGCRFVELLRPFCPVIYGFDPFAKNIPDDVIMVNSLEELFDISQIMVIHAGLTEETRGSVTKELLARLPDNGIVINTARGQIIDYDAIKAELLSGRLRAGLDVVTDFNLPQKGDPILKLDNVIFTDHHVGIGSWGADHDTMDIVSKNCLDNLERYSRGEELKFIITPERYRLTT